MLRCTLPGGTDYYVVQGSIPSFKMQWLQVTVKCIFLDVSNG